MSEDRIHPIHRLFRKRRIGICGGKRISTWNAQFAYCLGEELAATTNLVIVSGGFKYFRDTPEIPSADWSVISGALNYLRKHHLQIDTHVETLLPGKGYDLPTVARFRAGHTVVLEEKSIRYRRFRVVSASDAMVAIEGVKITAEMLDLALALEKPVFPLPFTGGTAWEYWRQNKSFICESFKISRDTAHRLEIINTRELSPNQQKQLAAEIRTLLLHQLKARCFVMMPFARQFQPLYKKAIKPAIEKAGFTCIRSDELHLVGNIMEAIRSAINTSQCAVALLTEFRPNVMYELGLAHAAGKPVVLLCAESPGEKINFPELPFDVRHESVITYSPTRLARLRESIYATLQYLRSG